MINSALILAGGFGTRLQAVVKDLPKPMAPVAGKPFLEYLLDELAMQEIKRVILSVGYKWETIRDYFSDSFRGMSISYSVETEPLGTGGAILKAVQSMEEEEFFIFNGDTFFNIRLSALAAKHRSQAADLSIALRRMANFDRYGVVRTDAQNRIVSFEEKKFYSEGNINGGIYLLNRKLMKEISLPSKFSFEKELMENYFSKRNFFGYPFDNFFIDIGIPEDYARAQSELPAVINEDFRHAAYKEWPAVDPSWTLFLDRDGVINKKIDGDYVRNLSQFEWLPGARESIVRLSALFGRTIVVSNQQGVGKGLMTRNAVEEIHAWLGEEIRMQGGKIDRFYFAPQLKSENSPMRKPGAGMALKAKEDFPEINFSKSLMVGDSMSDMEFGRKSGMRTVFISHGKKTGNDPLIDFVVAGLPELVSRIQ